MEWWLYPLLMVIGVFIVGFCLTKIVVCIVMQIKSWLAIRDHYEIVEYVEELVGEWSDPPSSRRRTNYRRISRK